jgi:hypothetical protein
MSQQLTQRFQGGRGSKEKGNSQKSEGEKKIKKINFYST